MPKDMGYRKPAKPVKAPKMPKAVKMPLRTEMPKLQEVKSTIVKNFKLF